MWEVKYTAIDLEILTFPLGSCKDCSCCKGSYRVDGTLGSGFDSAEPGARLDLKPCSSPGSRADVDLGVQSFWLKNVSFGVPGWGEVVCM